MSGTSSGATNGIKIETYWNVNTDDASKALDQLGIKIETYWNVNECIKLSVSFDKD